MLSIINLASKYEEKDVIVDATFNVNEGEVVLISGANGCGKSTLLKSIFRLMEISSGDIIFENNNLNNVKPFQMASKKIYFLQQNNFLFESLTVEENLRTSSSRRRYLNPHLNSIFEQILEKKASQLSGGERKLLSFYMAFQNNPKLLLMDEPFNGLDEKSRNKLIDSILKYKHVSSYLSIVLVSHTLDAPLIDSIINSKYILKDGKITKDTSS